MKKLQEVELDIKELMKLIYPEYYLGNLHKRDITELTEDELGYAKDLAEEISHNLDLYEKEVKAEARQTKLTKQDVILQRAYEQVKERGLA